MRHDVGRQSCRRDGLRGACQVHKLDVFERDLFGRLKDIQLPGDDAFVGHRRIDDIAGDDTVDADGDVLAHATDVHFIEVAVLPDGGDAGAVGGKSGRFRRFVENAPRRQFVVERINFHLHARHCKAVRVFDLRTNLNAAVADPVFAADLEFQFEIPVRLLAAQKRECFDAVGRRTDDRSVPNLPVTPG